MPLPLLHTTQIHNKQNHCLEVYSWAKLKTPAKHPHFYVRQMTWCVSRAIYFGWKAYFLPQRDWENKPLTSKPAPGSDLQTHGAPRRPAEPWCWSHPWGEDERNSNQEELPPPLLLFSKQAMVNYQGSIKNKKWNSCTVWVRNGKAIFPLWWIPSYWHLSKFQAFFPADIDKRSGVLALRKIWIQSLKATTSKTYFW